MGGKPRTAPNTVIVPHPARQTFAKYGTLGPMRGDQAGLAAKPATDRSTATPTSDSSVTRTPRPVAWAKVVFPALGSLLGRMVATTAAASLFVFLLLEISLPGGFRAVVLPNGDSRSPRARQLIDEFHLDDNILVRYLHWAGGAVRGDFGRSTNSGDSVTNILLPRLSISLEIMLVGFALTVLIGLPLGLLAVARDGRRGGTALNLLLGLSQSVPVFVTPIFLIALFAVQLRWLPAAGWTRISDSFTQNLKGLVLPITALVMSEVGIVARIVRADVLRVMESEFVAAAKGKGLSTRYILFRHTLRPASLGLMNVMALNISSLLTGALVIELLFGIGAIGQVLLESTLNRDLYLILGVTTYAVGVYVVLNTIVDGLMLLLDPRVRRRR